MSKWLVIAVAAALGWAFWTGRLDGVLGRGGASGTEGSGRTIFAGVLLCGSARDLQVVLHKTQQAGTEGRAYAMKKANCWMSKTGDRATIIDDSGDPIELQLSDGRRAYAKRGSL